jgi:hypothetical protein
VQLFVCLSVPGSTNQVTRSKSNVSGKTSLSGHLANVVVFLCPGRRSGAVNRATLYSLVVSERTVCVSRVVVVICNCLVTPSDVQSVRYCRPTMVKVGTWRQIPPKLHRVRFYENRSGCVQWLRTDTQANTTKLFLQLFVEDASEM